MVPEDLVKWEYWTENGPSSGSGSGEKGGKKEPENWS